MNHVKITTAVLLIYLSNVEPRMQPAPTQPRPPPPPSNLLFPKGLSNKEAAKFRVPSKAFCSQMELKPADHYFLLPWWYHYCQNLRERKERKMQNNVFYLPMYKNVLDRLRLYRKAVRNKQIEIPQM